MTQALKIPNSPIKRFSRKEHSAQQKNASFQRWLLLVVLFSLVIVFIFFALGKA